MTGFGIGFVLGMFLGVILALICLDRYYKIYISQIVDWIMEDLKREAQNANGNK